MGALVAALRVSWAALRRMAALGEEGYRLHRCYAPMPHCYRSQIGVEPPLPGHGFAGKLLRSMLARMDAAGTHAYLETAKEGNVALYQHFGFAVAAVCDLGSGLRVWAMYAASPGWRLREMSGTAEDTEDAEELARRWTEHVGDARRQRRGEVLHSF